MYLRPRSPSNLGAYQRFAPVPALPQLRRSARRLAALAYANRVSIPQQMAINARARRLRGLGDDSPAITDLPAQLNPDTGAGYAVPDYIAAQPGVPLATGYPAGQAPLDVLSMPSQPQAPVSAAVAVNYTQQNISGNPLDYASPQAAIAAGLPRDSVNAAWTLYLSSFPTQQAAIQAGIPAGVVTSFWGVSRTLPPVASWLNGTTLGIRNKYLVTGVVGIGLLAALGGRRR